MASQTLFGAPMKSHFLIDPNYRNLNHGSFGTYPKQVLQTQQSFRNSLESAPDVFIRYTQSPLLDESRQTLATLLNIPVSDCVLVKNATTGVNTILHNLAITRTLTPTDAVIYFETAYGAVERTLFALKESWGVQLRKVKYTFPLGEGELIARFRDVVESVKREGLVPKVAVFETVVSMPGVRFPFEEVTRVCKELGILSLIDGAHGVGMVELDLEKLGVDFFTSNCYKWLYTPRSCAVLYVPARNQHLIRTCLPTSWGYSPLLPAPSAQGADEDEVLPPSILPSTGKSAFVTLFQLRGTTDDSAYYCVPAAMKFRAEVCGGEEAIHSYLEKLAGEAGDVVAGALGTDVLRAVKGDQGGLGCGMVTVRLPIRVNDALNSSSAGEGVVDVRSEDVSGLTQWMHGQMVDRRTYVPVFQHGSWLFTRLSAQIYLDRADFEWLAGVLKEILGGVEGYLDTLKVPKAL
ncbi:pyridoxal phosphate-dependent transferase [Aspergillus varians]